MTGAELAKLCTGPWVGTLTCFRRHEIGAAVSHGRRPRLLGRRAGGDGGRANARRSRGRRRENHDRLGGAAGRHRKEDRARSGHARHPSRPRRQPRLPQGDRHRQRRRRLRQGRPRHRGHLRFRPPHRRQPGAARIARRLRQGDGQAHRPHLQPMPAHDPVRVRAHAGRAGPQRADHRARRRRLVRPQDPHLRRRGGGRRRRHAARPPGEIHRRPAGVVRLRHPRARECRQGPHRGEQVRRDPGLRHRRAVGRRRLLAIPAHQRVRGDAGAQHHRRPLHATSTTGRAPRWSISTRCRPRSIAPSATRSATRSASIWSTAPLHALDIDPIDMRRRNVFPDDAYPTVTASGVKIKDMSHQRCIEALVERMDYAELRAEQARLRKEGIHRGIGIASFIKGTAPGAAGLLRRRRRADLAAGRLRHQARAQRRRHLRGRRHRAGPGHQHGDGPDRRHRARRAHGKRARALGRHRRRALRRRHLRLARHRHRRRGGVSRRPRPARRDPGASPACCCRPIPPRSTSPTA